MIEPLKDKFYGMDYPPLATKKKPDLEDVVEKVNELIDAHNTKEEKFQGIRRIEDIPGYDPLSTYKARLKLKVGERAGSEFIAKYEILDIIDEE